jgi:hypothetical protein
MTGLQHLEGLQATSRGEVVARAMCSDRTDALLATARRFASAAA